VVAVISLELLSMMLTVRVDRSAACGDVLVVMPVAIITVHSVSGDKSAAPAVSVKLVLFVAEPAGATANVVEEHPLVVGEDSEPRLNQGSTNTMVSPVLSTQFNLKRKPTEVGADAKGW
jgi:hypothetical protein